MTRSWNQTAAYTCVLVVPMPKFDHSVGDKPFPVMVSHSLRHGSVLHSLTSHLTIQLKRASWTWCRVSPCTATVTGCPIRCKLSMHKSCCAQGHENQATL